MCCIVATVAPPPILTTHNTRSAMSIISSEGAPPIDDDLAVSIQMPFPTATVQQTASSSTDDASAQELFQRGPTWYTGFIQSVTIKDPVFVLYPDEFGPDRFRITLGKIRTDNWQRCARLEEVLLVTHCVYSRSVRPALDGELKQRLLSRLEVRR